VERQTIDPKRTGVKAREIPEWPERPDESARYYGNPGDMLRTANADGSLYGFLVACPGCGQFGAIPVCEDAPVRWSVVSGFSDVGGVKVDAGPGDVNDVTTLSLTPSILKRCCGWHGFLRRGVFESC
jgi:hypothetical protein